MAPRIVLRRAVADDQKAVTTLVAKSGGASRYRKRYGAFNSSLLDSAYLSIVAYDPDDQEGCLLGFVSFSDGPRDSAAEPWLNEANNLFGQNWTTHSLLWVSFLVADPVPDVEQRAVERMMRAAFATLPEIDFAVCTLPLKEDTPSEMTRHFRKLRSGDQGAWLPGGAIGGAKGGESVLLCEREMLVPSLAVRQAVVEDNDDLVPIFKEQEDALKESYGEFYLAELIKNQDANNVTLVAEHAGRAIGLLALSRWSGSEQLREHFNLRRYGNLVKRQGQGKQTSKQNKSKKNDNNGGGEGVMFYSILGDDEEELNSICSQLCFARGGGKNLVVIDPLSLVDNEDEKQDIELMTSLIAKRLKSPDVKQGGALLLNYPSTAAQAQLMAKNKLLPNGFICGDSSSNSEDNTLKKDLFAYISSGGRNVESSSSGGAEEKDNEEKKSESKDNDNNNDDDGKQDETNSQIQESFVPPDWVNIADDVEWLTKVMDAIDPLEDLSVGFDSMDIYGSNQSNAFAITMFCLDGMFESRACDFLPHAFKAFPDLEYCLLTVPSTVLLESRLVRGYTPALPKAGTSYSHSLFILHRDTVLASTYLSVQRLFPSSLNNGSDERRDEIDTMMIQQKKEQEEDEANGAVGKDLELIKSINEKNIQGYKLGVAVEKLLKSNLSPKKAQEVRDLLTVVGDEDKSAVSENPPRAAFVATIGTTGAVGIIILDRSSLSADRINFYKANFDLENYLVMDRFRTKAQALITALIVDPIFHHQTRFILKEAMRLFEKTLIYYQNDPSSSPDSWAYHPPRLVYQHFLPATPRIRPQPQPLEPQPFNIIAANSKVTNKADIQIAYEKQDHTMPPKGFALQFLSRAMLSEPRLSVQARIVIIGATATTAAFLQRFLLNPTMFYSNVTLISPTGFPRPKPSSTASSVQVVNEDMFDETKMASLTLESRCRLLLASVTSIDRENKTLTLCRTDQTTTNYFADGSGGDILPYDYLIVTDELVDSTKFDLADGSRELMAQPDAWNPHIEDGTAVGMNNEIVSPVFSLTHPDVDSFVDKAIEESNGGDIIVYGSTLQAAAAVGGLLARGISPERISFIRPGWVTPQLVEKEEPTKSESPLGRRASRMSANDMKRGSHDDDFGEEGFTDWVRLKGCILGDDRAENLMTDTLSSLGVSDRNDIELLGVSASKASIVNRAASAGGAEGAAASGEGGDNESSRHAGGRITDNNSVGPGSSSASSANGSYLAQKEGESKATEGEGKESEAWSDVDNDEGPKVQISNLEIAVFQKIGTAETMSFPCAVLLTCHNINIRPSLFHALNDSGLAYDGRLVVQPQSMQTSDPFIFAGGDITKFSRKYAHLSHDHCYFSNFDIGQYLADKFSTFVDPLLAYANSVSSSSASPPGPGSLTSTSANNDNNRAAAASISSSMQPQNNNHNNPTTNILVDVSSEVPIFKKPRTVSCCIPGGYHARSLMASAVDPKMVVKEKDGQIIEEASGSAAWNSLNTGAMKGKEKTDRSCVLRLDANARLVDFSYFGPTPVEGRNIGCLIGLHASYVNGCASLHQKGGVSDWISFFRSKWAQALYHDRFPQLIEMLRNRLRADDAAKDVLELMKRALEDGKDDQAVAKILTNAIGSEGERVTPGTAKRVEQVGFEWLTSNKTSFPFYKLPERATK